MAKELVIVSSVTHVFKGVAVYVETAKGRTENAKMDTVLRKCLRDGDAIATIELPVLALLDIECGIPLEVRRRIFDAFFTTKGTKGSGLGLWLSLGIVHKHGGHVQLRTSVAPGCSGTCFSIFLPCHPTMSQLAA